MFCCVFGVPEASSENLGPKGVRIEDFPSVEPRESGAKRSEDTVPSTSLGGFGPLEAGSQDLTLFGTLVRRDLAGGLPPPQTPPRLTPNKSACGLREAFLVHKTDAPNSQIGVFVCKTTALRLDM